MNNSSQLDLLICSLPSGVINRAPAAPAILKACAVQHGFSAKTVDLSLLFYKNQCGKNFDMYTKYSHMFEPLIEFDRNSAAYAAVCEWLDQTVALIKNLDPKFVALSVFSNFQHRATVLLAQQIRQHLPQIKIVLGGYGLTALVKESFKGFTGSADQIGNFDAYILKKRLSDFQIKGEGEDAIVSVLQGATVSTDPVDLMQVPVPDFDDYDLDQYMWHNVPALTITGSKGCVRACTFCNVPEKFGRYRRRTGAHIAAEMIELNRRYGIQKFEFTDSLVNGSQKDFYELVEVLSQHNNKSSESNKITWYGQYICRPQSQVIDGIYPLMKRSGALNLVIGAESGSNAVLEAMHKKMTVQDLYDELDQFEQHQLQAQLLILIGFYNETWPRFLETLEFLARCFKYTASGVVTRIAAGFPLVITPGVSGSYLYDHANELGIVFNKNNAMDWRYNNDPDNTWMERIKRKIIVQLVVNKMGVPMTGNGILEIRTMIEQLKIYEQQLRSSDPSNDTRLAEFETH